MCRMHFGASSFVHVRVYINGVTNAWVSVMQCYVTLCFPDMGGTDLYVITCPIVEYMTIQDVYMNS